MYMAAGGPGLKQSGLAVIWFGEASFGGEVCVWLGGIGPAMNDLVLVIRLWSCGGPVVWAWLVRYGSGMEVHSASK